MSAPVASLTPGALTRREFMIRTAMVGGGLAIGVVGPDTVAAAGDSASNAAGNAQAAEVGAWILIGADDTITVRVPTPEIGNGVLTQVPLTVTEELNCDWSKVRAEFAPVNRDYREKGVYSASGGALGFFSGRSTMSTRLQALLQVGASARERLKAAAAARWGVPVSVITASDSVLTNTRDGRTLRYGEVAAEAAKITLASEPKPKPHSEWRLLGKTSTGKLNNPEIVKGAAVFGIDVRLPNMLYAALMQAPVHGGRLKRYDFDAVKNRPGVRGVVVVDPREARQPLMPAELINDEKTAAQSGIAIVADHYWQARQALEAMPIEWDDGPGGQWQSTEQVYAAAHAAVAQPGTQVFRNTGSVDDAFKSGKLIEATYLTPFCDHVALEPLNGTACVTKDRVDLWHPTQHPLHAHLVAISETGVAPENVYVHQTFVGGGFGRRVYGDDVRMVVAVAKKFPGRPMHVIWSREQSITQGRYRALQVTRLKASLDERGYPRAIAMHAAGRGIYPVGSLDSPYMSGPNARIEYTELPLHVLTGPYRGPSYNSNAFVFESFIDECAHAAGIDPLDYRLHLLHDWPVPGWKQTLLEVARKAHWGKKLPKGQAQGLAVGSWTGGGDPKFGTTVATIATVEVSQEGEVKVLQIDCAFDCGSVLNPDAVRQQMEGGSLFGMNMTLLEELTLQNGRIVESNFHEYPMLRMSDVPPRVNVHFGGTTGGEHCGEIGEAPAGPIGPAIANAIYRVTGKRIRSTPLRKQDLRWT